MTIGERIRRLRQSKKMTQKQLGELAGIAEPTIRRYELGKLNPKRETIQKIADALGVNMLDLMDIGSHLDQYFYDISDIKVLGEVSPVEKEKRLREANKFFSEFDFREAYNMLPEDEKDKFWKMVSDDITGPEQKRTGKPSVNPKPDIALLPKDEILPEDARKVAIRYSKLDRYGKSAVQAVLSTEEVRVKEQAELDEILTKPEPKIIPLYLVPAAAGYASPIYGSDYENYELTPEDPQGAMFAIKVQGDSMEPHFPDGSIVFCNKDPVDDGDIGVFCLDGESYIKQYHYEKFMGMTYLFSLNRDRADLDKLITRSSGQYLACMGRVITRRRYPLPR